MKRYLSSLSSLVLALSLTISACGGSDNPTTPGSQYEKAIKGTVVDAMTMERIPGAVVSTVPPTQSVFTDADGLYTIAGVPKGEYTVVVTKQGYDNGSSTVSLSEAMTADFKTADVALYKAGTGGGEKGHAPGAPFDPAPDSARSGVGLDAALAWKCTDPDPGDQLTYDVYFGTSNPPTQKVAGDLAEPTFRPVGMETGTTYYWLVSARDRKGNVSSGPVWYFTTIPASPANALNLKGDGYATFVPVGGLNLSGGSFTVEAWVRPTTHASWNWVLSHSRGNDALDVLLGIDANGSFHFSSRSAANILYSVTKVADEKWYHIAGVLDAENSRILLYVNGELEAQKSVFGPGIIVDEPMLIGARHGSQGIVGEYLNGQVDEVRIWRGARTREQIAGNMGRLVAPGTDGLVAYWNMNQASGKNVMDAVTGGHNGALNGTYEWVKSTAPIK